MKDQLSIIKTSVSKLADQFMKWAKNYEWTPFPGYSHTQQAMLSSIGHYFAAFAEALMDDGQLIGVIQKHIDQNPLGSAAGFGVSLPLDREMTTKELGFIKTQNNSLYCQNSRGKFEALVLEGLVQVMMTLSRFATDILFFTSQECGYFTVSDGMTTGSSIMPQKKNLDCMEMVRANAKVIMSHQALIQSMTEGLISGYHRDLQLIKKPLMESFKITASSLKVVGLVLDHIKSDQKVIKKKISVGIFAADIANKMVVKKNMPFREAYQLAMGEVKKVKIDFKKNLKSKISPGAPGHLF